MRSASPETFSKNIACRFDRPGHCRIAVSPSNQASARLGEIFLKAGGCGAGGQRGRGQDAFPGSTEVGKIIVRPAAENLKKVSFELGGKSPNIIFKDAGDLSAAIAGAANAIFFNHGQCCCTGSRLMVEHEVFEDVVADVAEQARKIKLGPGLDSTTQMGPLVSEEQLARVTGYLHQGRQLGACYVTGGRRSSQRGYFVQPTIIKDVKPTMSIVREEIFGPVVVAESFTKSEELISRANPPPTAPRRRRLDAQQLPGAPYRRRSEGRNGLGQLLQRVRRRAAARRL